MQFIKAKKLILSFMLLMLAACGQPQAKDTQIVSSEQEKFRLVTITKDLHHPWSLAFLPNGEYLVTERRGQLLRISPDGRKTLINGAPKVYAAGQGGLHDILLEQDYKDGGWLYLSFSGADKDNPEINSTEVARGRLDLRQNRIKDLETIFISQPKVEGAKHYGSRLAFGGDGKLYLSTGDRSYLMEEAQNPTNHIGVMIRLNPDGGLPEDNPFIGHETIRPEIFSYGHRNPQGLTRHPQTGVIWSNEHGPKGGDELNIIKSGKNYGWPAVTFGIDYSGVIISDKTTAPGMEDPVVHWTPSIAPSGITFYAGDKFPNWKGDLFVGALAHRHLRRLEMDGDKVIAQEEILRDRNERIRDVREGPDGYLYILTDDDNGRLIKLMPSIQ